MRGLRAAVLVAGLFSARTAAGQQPVRLDHFDGWERWPLYAPGDLPITSGKLIPLRITFDGLFPGPRGFGRPPLDSITMLMDVIEETFHGAPALWIQWLSRPSAKPTASPALDALLVDRGTFRLLFRLAASARGEWAGRYEVLQARPKLLVQATVNEDGTAERHVLQAPADYFDFATYQFLLPFIELREGMAFRLSGYEYLEKTPEVLPVRVVGRARVADAAGTMHDVWQVDIMPAHRATLITFYVSPEPPFFYGWDYRLTKDGSTALKLTLRGWTPVSPG